LPGAATVLQLSFVVQATTALVHTLPSEGEPTISRKSNMPAQRARNDGNSGRTRGFAAGGAAVIRVWWSVTSGSTVSVVSHELPWSSETERSVEPASRCRYRRGGSCRCRGRRLDVVGAVAGLAPARRTPLYATGPPGLIFAGVCVTKLALPLPALVTLKGTTRTS
jgi:hypothetical protein